MCMCVCSHCTHQVVVRVTDVADKGFSGEVVAVFDNKDKVHTCHEPVAGMPPSLSKNERAEIALKAKMAGGASTFVCNSVRFCRLFFSFTSFICSLILKLLRG
jgi:hypothetical protein